MPFLASGSSHPETLGKVVEDGLKWNHGDINNEVIKSGHPFIVPAQSRWISHLTWISRERSADAGTGQIGKGRRTLSASSHVTQRLGQLICLTT